MPKLDKDGKEIVEESLELDEATVTALVEKTAEAIQPGVEKSVIEAVEKTIKESVELGFTEKTQEAITTAVGEAMKTAMSDLEDKLDANNKKSNKLKNTGIDADSHLAKALEAGKFPEKVASMDPAVRFYRAMLALDPETGNREELKAYNSFAIASQMDARAKLLAEKGQNAIAKTGYANETTAADGSVLIPDAEFITTVFDNLPKYGVAFQFADVRQTDRTSVRVLSLDSGLTFYSTAEAGVKTGAKLAFAKTEVSLQKYAVIVPATDELSDDAAVDYWNLVTRELARAYAKKADELVFTDTTYGITNLTGVVTENVSGAGTTVTWSDLLDTEAKLEDDLDTSNYRWFMRKESWYRLVELKGSTNDHYLSGSLNTATGWVANINSPTTPWGTPVQFTRVLPTTNAVSSNDAFAVFGDLSNTMLFNKRGMALTMLTEATVKDSEGSDLNLATQDASAMRAVIRLLHICPKANRPKFGILGTGTVS